MRILFIIRSLNAGGAERQLVMLANGLAERGHEVGVALFYGGVALASDLKGVEIFDLHKKGRWDMLPFFCRLRKVARDFGPSVIHGYLGTANLFATMLKPFIRDSKTVWGVRASNVDFAKYGVVERLHFRVEIFCSRFADLIIANSEAGKRYVVSRGFPEKNIHVVYNGIDTEKFKPNAKAGLAVRHEWGISENVPLVGMVARLDPLKDHFTFLRAAKAITESNQDARFVCVGDGPTHYKDKLKEFSHSLGLGEKLVWAGSRLDVQQVFNALDVFCLTSITEGFPNALCEAMACNVASIATNVGDVLLIVGDLEKVVPIGDVDSICEKVNAILKCSNKEMNLRKRIIKLFSLDKCIMKTESLLTRLLESKDE